MDSYRGADFCPYLRIASRCHRGPGENAQANAAFELTLRAPGSDACYASAKFQWRAIGVSQEVDAIQSATVMICPCH